MASNAANDLTGFDVQELFLEVNSLSNRLRWLESPQTMLPAGERAVLQCLVSAGSQTVPQLARNRCTSRQNVQVLVNRLRRRGLVEIAPNPAHQRSSLVTATAAALQLVETMRNEHTQLASAALSACAPDEIKLATVVLRKLREVVGGQSDTPSPSTGANKAASSQNAPPAQGGLTPTAGELPVNLL